MLSDHLTAMTWSVSQLNEYANRLLMQDEQLQGVLVAGEVSNFKAYPSGHWYFTLKDGQSQVRCVMFKQYNRGMRGELRDGMSITVGASASIYLRDGSFQLYVHVVDQAGTGALYEQFEQLKRTLEKEGLFDAAHKQTLPKFPKRIGVVTSSAGAVIRDIVDVARRRNPKVDILLVPVAVQGQGAAQETVDAIRLLDARDDIELIIIGRGGGSLEDLWSYNEESVARAIYACKTPLISAVGHETDVTIADYVADLRAPTPSAAAELAVPLMAAVEQRLDELQVRVVRNAHHRLDEYRRRERMLTALFSPARAAASVEANRTRCAQLDERLLRAAQQKVSEQRHRLSTLEARLEGGSMERILSKGYALVRDEQGRMISGVAALTADQNISLTMRDGQADVQVLTTRGKGD